MLRNSCYTFASGARSTPLSSRVSTLTYNSALFSHIRVLFSEIHRRNWLQAVVAIKIEFGIHFYTFELLSCLLACSVCMHYQELNQYCLKSYSLWSPGFDKTLSSIIFSSVSSLFAVVCLIHASWSKDIFTATHITFEMQD